VHAEEASPTTAQTVRTRLHEFAAALMARDMNVRVDERRGALVAKNPAAEQTGDPPGRHMNPGLSQTVALSVHDDNTLHWYWQWSGADRGAPPEYEYMCPAGDADAAAGKVAQVLRLIDEPAGAGQ
jgi:hypothetical protein